MKGDFTNTNLDKEVDSDFEDEYVVNKTDAAKADKARQDGWHDEIAF